MRKAKEFHRDKLLDALSKAFENNKSVNYVVRQDDRRNARIRELMRYSFDVCQEFGEVWLSDFETGCALLLFSENKKTTLKSIFWDIRLALSAIGIFRVGKVMSREAKIHAYHPVEPFCYLWFIGVDPEDQGKGIGSSLLHHIIARCMELGYPIYLETSVEKNITWYKQFGFEVYQTLDFGYTLYLLRRV